MANLNRKIISWLIVPVVVLGVSACNEESPPEEASINGDVVLETTEEKVSYLMGYATARQLTDADMSFQADALLLAIEDVKAGKPSRLSDEDTRKVSSDFQAKLQENRLNKESAKHIEAGNEYRKANAQKSGVIETESGIQYEVLKSAEAEAKKPTPEDQVKVHYHGTLIDGTVFDSSVERGREVTFGVTNVIEGWTEVLQLMSVGDKWRVVIPSNLAYPNGTRNIAPGSTLIFEIELFEINPTDT